MTSMYCRTTLKLLGAAALGLSPPVVASQSTEKLLLRGVVPEYLDYIPPMTPHVACSVVGVGGVGCNIVTRAFLSGLQVETCRTQFACVDTDLQSIRDAIEANGLHPGSTPIRPVRLGRYG